VYDRAAVSRECRVARARKDARVRVVRIDPLTGDRATSRRGRATSSGAISTSTSQHTGPSSTPGSAYLLIEQSGAIPDSQRVVRCTPRAGPPAQSRDALSRRADTEAIYERVVMRLAALTLSTQNERLNGRSSTARVLVRTSQSRNLSRG
jgi:hypothetical protein